MYDFISKKRAKKFGKLGTFTLKPTHILCDVYDMWEKKVCQYVITGTPNHGYNNRFHGFIFSENLDFKFRDIKFSDILNIDEVLEFYHNTSSDSEVI